MSVLDGPQQLQSAFRGLVIIVSYQEYCDLAPSGHSADSERARQPRTIAAETKELVKVERDAGLHTDARLCE